MFWIPMKSQILGMFLGSVMSKDIRINVRVTQEQLDKVDAAIIERNKKARKKIKNRSDYFRRLAKL